MTQLLVVFSSVCQRREYWFLYTFTHVLLVLRVEEQPFFETGRQKFGYSVEQDVLNHALSVLPSCFTTPTVVFIFLVKARRWVFYLQCRGQELA